MPFNVMTSVSSFINEFGLIQITVHLIIITVAHMEWMYNPAFYK